MHQPISSGVDQRFILREGYKGRLPGSVLPQSFSALRQYSSHTHIHTHTHTWTNKPQSLPVPRASPSLSSLPHPSGVGQVLGVGLRVFDVTAGR